MYQLHLGRGLCGVGEESGSFNADFRIRGGGGRAVVGLFLEEKVLRRLLGDNAHGQHQGFLILGDHVRQDEPGNFEVDNAHHVLACGIAGGVPVSARRAHAPQGVGEQRLGDAGDGDIKSEDASGIREALAEVRPGGAGRGRAAGKRPPQSAS